MADATDLKSVVRKDVRVRLPPSAPIISITYGWLIGFLSHLHNGVRESSGSIQTTLATSRFNDLRSLVNFHNGVARDHRSWVCVL
jgi:hypothetical protein